MRHNCHIEVFACSYSRYTSRQTSMPLPRPRGRALARSSVDALRAGGGLGRHLVMIVMMMRTMAASTRSGGSFDRHAHQLAVTHAALGDDVLAEMLHLARLAAQHRDLEASVMVEMHMQRGERQLVLIVKARTRRLESWRAS